MDREADRYTLNNRELWDELAPVHFRSYDIKGFLSGHSSLDAIQMKDLGSIKGKKVLHLQCHIGLDTLSLARLGADVTGIDISPRSIEFAEKLKKRSGLDARFICSDIYRLEGKLKAGYDIVYTGQGVLCWLKDIKEWGRIISRYLEKGGMFYIMEGHPFSCIFESGGKGIRVEYDYFKPGPLRFDDWDADYSDPSYRVRSPSYEWQWTAGDIVNSLIGADLRIERFEEYPFLFFKRFKGMKKGKDGFWHFKSGTSGYVPLMFTLKARKI